MSDINQQLAEKLKILRLERNISQDKLAKLTEIDRSYIGRIDRGEVNITIDTLFKIAKALKCQPRELIPEIDYSND